MVCLGNICRSPLADGLLKSKVESLGLNVVVDSAGTSGHHSGESPDPRMRATAKHHGLSIDHLRARQFVTSDFDEFDLIYAMDSSNFNNILKLARNDEDRSKIMMILNEITPGLNKAVPDPYYGGDEGFEDVYKMLDEATDIIINTRLK